MTINKTFTFLALFLALLRPLRAEAADVESEGIKYSTYRSGWSTYAQVMGFADGGPMADVKIPQTVQEGSGWLARERNVVRISGGAFQNQTVIKNVSVAQNVTEVNDNAFNGCSNMEIFSMNATSATFGSDVFKGCTSLRYLKIPGGTARYNAGMFSDCENLEAVRFNSSISGTSLTGAFPLFETRAVTAYVESNYVNDNSAKNAENNGLYLAKIVATPTAFLQAPKVAVAVNGDGRIELSVSNNSSFKGEPVRGITFGIKDTSIATVDALGRVKGLRDGTTTAVIVYGEGTADEERIEITVTVGDGTAKDVFLTPSSATLQIQQTAKFVLGTASGSAVGKPEWTVPANSADLISITPSADGMSCTVKAIAHSGSATLLATLNGETVQASINISSKTVNADGVISVTADHNVIQEISYCGRGNPNEPLTRVLFYNADITSAAAGNMDRSAIIGELMKYKVTVVPNFYQVGGVDEITSLHGYVRIYPQTAAEQSNGNPLRGDMTEGKRPGPVPPQNAIDLGVFDYRAPLLASHQTVFDLGKLESNGEPIIPGKEYSIGITREVAEHIMDHFEKIYAGLGTNATYRQYFDPRFYIYVCGDINENANDMRGRERNSIGAKVTGVTTPRGEYTGAGILSSYRNFRSSASTGLDVNWPANSHHLMSRDQRLYSRVILYRRVLAYTPFDGYSNYYRIPGLTDLADGTLVMTTDARKYHNHDVSNNFDVISRVSTDNGATWSEPHIVVEGKWGSNGEDDCNDALGYGDAAVSALPTPGNILAVFISGKGLASSNGDGPNISYSISTTSGRSWGDVHRIPTDLFHYDSSNIPNGAIACPGPGRMCLITTGQHKGKVLFCAYMWVDGNGGYGPLNFLAFDEKTKEWTNLGYMGDTRDVQFGESQIVEIPQIKADGSYGDPLFLLTVRNEKGDARKWYLLKPDSEGKFPSFERNMSRNVANVTLVNASKGAKITEITEYTSDEENHESFGFGAGGCNSNFFVYDNTDGNTHNYYLIQSLPRSLTNETGYGTGSNRARLSVKVAEISSLLYNGALITEVNGTTVENKLVWHSKGLDFSDPLGVLSTVGTINDSPDKGYMTTGYSCVSPQKDGRIGVASEEYPVAYRPGPKISGDRTDVLLGGWYSSISFESLTYNNPIEQLTDGREIPKPETFPSTTTFKLDVTQVQQNNEAGHAGVFVPESAYSLPVVEFTVDPDEVKVLKGEKWRIDYDVNYRLHGETTGVKLYSYRSPWFDASNPDATTLAYDKGEIVYTYESGEPVAVVANESRLNPDGTWTVKIQLPMTAADFKNIVVPILAKAAGTEEYIGIEVPAAGTEEYEKYIAADRISRISGNIHADDSFFVRARVGVYPEKNEDGTDYDDLSIDDIKNNNSWTRDRIDLGTVNVTGYYAVSPSRKIKVHIMPQGVDASVEVSTEYATATFSNKTNVEGYDASQMWLFARPSYDLYPVRMHALIPSNSPASFRGFTLSPEHVLTEEFDPTDETLIRNLRHAWIEGYESDGITPIYGVASRDNSDYPEVKKGDVLDSKSLRAFNVHVYPDPQQLQFYVPSKYTYPGDEDDYDCLDIYAWFDSEGGLYSTAELRYGYFDIDTFHHPVGGSLKSDGGYVSDDRYGTPGSGFNAMKAKKPNPQFDRIGYPQNAFNTVNIFTEGKQHLELFWDVSCHFDYGYYDLTLVPDIFGYKNSCVVTVWYVDEKDGTCTHAPSTRQFAENPNGSPVAVGRNETVMLTNIAGNGHLGYEYSWASPSGLPQEVKVPISFHGCFGDKERKGQIGLMLLSVTDRPVEENQVDAFIAGEQEYLNGSASAYAASRSGDYAEPRLADDSQLPPRVLYHVAYPIYHIEDLVTDVDRILPDADVQNGPARYFDLLGREVLNPQEGSIYIKVAGGNAIKEIFRNE